MYQFLLGCKFVLAFLLGTRSGKKGWLGANIAQGNHKGMCHFSNFCLELMAFSGASPISFARFAQDFPRSSLQAILEMMAGQQALTI